MILLISLKHPQLDHVVSVVNIQVTLAYGQLPQTKQTKNQAKTKPQKKNKLKSRKKIKEKPQNKTKKSRKNPTKPHPPKNLPTNTH